MIREATAADLPTIRALQHCLTEPATDLFDALPHGVTLVSTTEPAELASSTAESGAQERPTTEPDARVPTAASTSIPVGYVHAFPGEPATVTELVVEPDHRREGRGRLLLASVLARLRREGCPAVTLTVATENEAAQRLYESLGFERDATLPGFYEGGGDAYRLRRPL
ncbi:GNAT family N-acetyltransferase [Haloarchaeobius sp. TZWWS8]|uniref:GNAT family N-acetyltransferase n=1 Tax=Haloarchaeobius sp. TZWWS8 TaxID=3446121 RepID=UPI003EB6EC23